MQTALSNQIHAGLDLVFSGLTGCFSHGLESVSLRVIMREIPGSDRVRRLGVDGLVRFVRRRGARITRAKAAQVVETAREVLKLPEADWNAASAVLAADVTFFIALEEEIAKATAELSTVLPDTPAGILTSLPGVGIVTASAYGAAIGDPARFKHAAGPTAPRPRPHRLRIRRQEPPGQPDQP